MTVVTHSPKKITQQFYDDIILGCDFTVAGVLLYSYWISQARCHARSTAKLRSRVAWRNCPTTWLGVYEPTQGIGKHINQLRSENVIC